MNFEKRAPCAVLILACALLVGCGDGEAEDATATEWTAERDTVGDTIVVRTLAGSIWGAPATLQPEMQIGEFDGPEEYLLGNVNGFDVDDEGNIYLFDRQVPEFRKYDAEGTYVSTIGREGSGPGEYQQSDGGVAVLPDGRVLLRDPGNARMNVYSADGESLDTWQIGGGMFVSSRLVADTAGNVYTQVFSFDEDGRNGMARYGPDGEPGDTLDYPDRGYEGPTLTAQTENSRSRRNVPFTPTEQWTFSPHGYMVGGVSTSYAVDIVRPGGAVLRLGRATGPVAVTPGEREYQEEIVTEGMRGTDPGWSWDGPAIPQTKPPYQRVLAGRDGRIWVHLSAPGEQVPPEEDGGTTASDPGEDAAPAWRAPVIFDVFEPDGRYLGQVRAPDGFSTYPRPVFDGEHVWAVMRDEYDVQYLTRFRIERGQGDDV